MQKVDTISAVFAAMQQIKTDARGLLHQFLPSSTKIAEMD